MGARAGVCVDEPQVSYVGLNAAQTVFELVRCNNEKKAAALKADLKMSDPRCVRVPPAVVAGLANGLWTRINSVLVAQYEMSSLVWPDVVVYHTSKLCSVCIDDRVRDRFAFIKVQALIRAYNWTALQAFASEKKFPISHKVCHVCAMCRFGRARKCSPPERRAWCVQHVVDWIIEAGARNEASKYVSKLAKPEERFDYSMKLQ